MEGHPPVEPKVPKKLLMSPSTLGPFYCIASSISYTMMGICMRKVSEHCDPVWVNCVQASVGTIAIGFYMTSVSVRGRSLWPPLTIAAALMGLGALVQLGGSSYLWSLGQIGLSISNPLQMGVMLTFSAVLGFVFLHERVSGRVIASIIMLTVAVIFLSMGVNTTKETEVVDAEAFAIASESDMGSTAEEKSFREEGTFSVLLGITAAGFAGIVFAILTIGVRKVVTSNTSAVAIVFYINLMGILFLGPWSLQRLGVEGIIATAPSDLIVMLGVGVFNLFGFLLLTKALQLMNVVRVNVITNCLTVSLSVFAGILIFGELGSRNMFVGITLTLLGVVLIGLAENKER